jgi:hypothetical protein
MEVLRFEAAGASIESLFLPARDAGTGPKPLVIFAHGNTALIDDWLTALDGFRQRGVGVLLVEYPGYGRSTGTPFGGFDPRGGGDMFMKASCLALPRRARPLNSTTAPMTAGNPSTCPSGRMQLSFSRKPELNSKSLDAPIAIEKAGYDAVHPGKIRRAELRQTELARTDLAVRRDREYWEEDFAHGQRQ